MIFYRGAFTCASKCVEMCLIPTADAKRLPSTLAAPPVGRVGWDGSRSTAKMPSNADSILVKHLRAARALDALRRRSG